MSPEGRTSRLLGRTAAAGLACIVISISLAATAISGADEDYRYKFPCEPGVSCFVTTGLHGVSGHAISISAVGV